MLDTKTMSSVLWLFRQALLAPALLKKVINHCSQLKQIIQIPTKLNCYYGNVD